MPRRNKRRERRPKRKHLSRIKPKVNHKVGGGAEGNNRGKENERKFINAYAIAKKTEQLPPWFLEVRKATDEEDHHQNDAPVVTDIGDIPVQIKSTEKARDKFLATHREPPILCFFIRDGESPEHIVQRTFPEIKAEYARLKQLRKQSRP